MPFGPYSDFDDCVARNADKANPEAFCGWLQNQLKGQWPGERMTEERTSIRKTVRAETKLIDESEGLVEAIISTESLDRDGEVIRLDAWGKRLDAFRQHSPLMSSHDYTDLRKQIGTWENVRITDRGLEGTARYYVGKGNDEADWGAFLASKGNAAYSVGFIGHDFIQGDGHKSPSRTWTDVELLEISHVTVPSNPDALVAMARKGQFITDPIAIELTCEMLGNHEDKCHAGLTPPALELGYHDWFTMLQAARRILGQDGDSSHHDEPEAMPERLYGPDLRSAIKQGFYDALYH